AKTAPTLDLDGDPATDDIDETRMQFAAFSTGAIFGITYLGLSDEVYAASLHNTGVGVVDLLMEGTRGRLVDAGLAAAGIPTGSTLYYDFLRSFQAQVDAVDGWSYAAAAAERHPIHLTAIAGNDVNPPDQTVPPSATARLVNAMTPPMIRITETTTDPAGIRGVVYLTEGEHSSPLDPSTSLLATQEIQIGMATFFATFGTTIPVTNPGIIAQPAGAIVQP
ncbi:MAG TPA: hypothetical protein VLT59_16085, partial [Steroidobacteraceae bacterium]|nr:hypothetical protein [Steroidobacteraceae bacterium]